MPRKARIIVPGAFHHVMARGIEGRDLFSDDEDRSQFIKFLKEGLVQGEHRLYAWALLSNHYHLLIRVSDHPFSEMMRRLNSRYARYYSKKYQRRGYLFQDRYKLIVTQDQKYVEEIIRYIHLNPIRSGLCRSLLDLASYPWCSHGAIMGRAAIDNKETAKEILRRFGKTDETAREAYVRFMEEGLAQKEEDGGVIEAVRKSNFGAENMLSSASWVIGDNEFVKKVVDLDMRRKARLARHCAEQTTLDDIAKLIVAAMRISIHDLRCRSRGGKASDARKVFSYVSRRVYEFPIKEIGRYLGISGPPVSISIPEGEKIVKSGRILINI